MRLCLIILCCVSLSSCVPVDRWAGNEQHSNNLDKLDSSVIQGTQVGSMATTINWWQEFSSEAGCFKQLSDFKGVFPLGRTEAAGWAILVVEESGRLSIFRTDEGRYCPITTVESGITVSAVSPGGEVVAIGRGNHVEILSLPDGEQQQSLTRLEAVINHLAYAPDSKSLLLAGADGQVYHWYPGQERGDPQYGQFDLERYSGHGSVVNKVAYHPHGRTFLSADWDGKVNIWLRYDRDRFDGRYDKKLFANRYYFDETVRKRVDSGAPGEGLDHLVVSQDGQSFVIGSRTGLVEVWKIRGLELYGTLSAHKGQIRSLDVDPTFSILATVGRDGVGYIWSYSGEDDVEDEDERFEELIELRMPDLRYVKFLTSYDLLVGTGQGSLRVIPLAGDR